jgi:hypothetical protein
MKKTKKYAMGGGVGMTNGSAATNLLNAANVVNQGAQALTSSTPSVGMVPDTNSASSNLGQLNVGGFKKGGKVSSASKRADGCAIRGKTRA